MPEVFAKLKNHVLENFSSLKKAFLVLDEVSVNFIDGGYIEAIDFCLKLDISILKGKCKTNCKHVELDKACSSSRLATSLRLLHVAKCVVKVNLSLPCGICCVLLCSLKAAQIKALRNVLKYFGVTVILLLVKPGLILDYQSTTILPLV